MLTYTPTKKVAPAILAYIVALLYVYLCVSLISFVISSTNRDFDFIIFWLVSSVISIATLIFCSLKFSWIKSATLERKGDSLLYKVKDVVEIFGRDETKYTIESIDSLNIGRHNRIKIKGSIRVKEAMQQERGISYLVLEYFSDEMKEMLKEFAEKC